MLQNTRSAISERPLQGQGLVSSPKMVPKTRGPDACGGVLFSAALLLQMSLHGARGQWTQFSGISDMTAAPGAWRQSSSVCTHDPLPPDYQPGQTLFESPMWSLDSGSALFTGPVVDDDGTV